MTTALAAVTRRALLWTYAGSAVTLVLQLGYTATTARALPLSAFGPFASSQVLVALLGYLSLNAAGAAVARATETPRALVGSVWSLALAGGTGAALLAVLAAPLWARAWTSPHAATLVLVSVPAVFFAPLSVLALALLRQRLRYGAAVVAEVAGAVSGFGVNGVLVLATRQPWLLPVALDVSCAVTFAVAVALRRQWPFLAWDPVQIRALAGFITPVSCLNATYAALNALPQLVVSRLFGPTALAQLNRANMLVLLPQSQLSLGLMKVGYPLFSRLRDQAGQRRQATTAMLVLASGAALPLFGVLAGSAVPAVRVLLGDSWLPAAGLVPLVVAGAAGYVQLGLVSMAWESTGQLARIVPIQLALLAGTVVPVAVLAAGDGLGVRTVLWVFALSQVGAHGLQLAMLVRERQVALAVVLRAYAVHGGVAVALGAALHAVALLGRDRSPVAAAGVQAAAVLAAVLALAAGRRALPAWTTAAELGLTRRRVGRHSLSAAAARRSDRQPVSPR